MTVPEVISAKELRERLQDVVKKVRHGGAIYRSIPQSSGFRHRPGWQSTARNAPLESDSLYQAPAVGASESGDAAARHDEVLYR